VFKNGGKGKQITGKYFHSKFANTNILFVFQAIKNVYENKIEKTK